MAEPGTVQLGDTVKDTILGYKGVVTQITEYLYGCRRVGIELKGHEGKLEEFTFDEPRLEIVKSKAPKPKPRQNTGGDRPVMPRSGVRR